jgi:hypothetical protein
MMALGGERQQLTERKKYHVKERDKASRKLRDWQRKYDLHVSAAWEAEKKLLAEEMADERDTEGF